MPMEAVPNELLDQFLTLDPKKRREVFCTVWEAASAAAVGKRTVQRWVEEGSVNAVRVGPRYWLVKDSLREYLESRAAWV